MIRLLILVSSIFTFTFGSNLPPFFVENQKCEELVPIPLPWKNLSNKRFLNIKTMVKTKDETGNILNANGVEPSNFKVILSLASNKFLLSLTIGNDTPCEIYDSENSQEANFSIDFDSNIIELNKKQKQCNISKIERKDDSLQIAIGGLEQGCIKIDGIKVSKETVKIEAAKLNYLKCSIFGGNEVEEKLTDPGVEVEKRGHSHHH